MDIVISSEKLITGKTTLENRNRIITNNKKYCSQQSICASPHSALLNVTYVRDVMFNWKSAPNNGKLIKLSFFYLFKERK